MLIFTVIIIIVLLIIILISNYIYNISVRRNKMEVSNNSELVKEVVDKYIKWWNSQNFEEIEINSNDGLKLIAYYLPAKEKSNKTLIMAHGHSSYAQETGCMVEYYYSQGFNVLVPDNRAHGKSQGTAVGMGWLDRLDYIQWIDKAIALNGAETKILLHGMSMGAAMLMLLSGEKLLSNVKCIIEDSGYTSMKEIFILKLNKLPSFPIINMTSLICKLRAKYFFGDADCRKQVKKSNVPILFVHGNKDTDIPEKMAHELYDIARCEKEIFIAKNAGHVEAFITDRDDYIIAMEKFYKKYI